MLQWHFFLLLTVLKSFILNGLSLVSIYTFDYLLLPLATHGRVHRNIAWLYRVLWLIPLAATSLYLNVRMGINHRFSGAYYNTMSQQGSWAGVVAKRSYTLQHGTRSTVPGATYTGLASYILIL